MNLPNKLTVSRMLCVPVFLVFTYVDNVWTRLLALAIFIGAGVTDLYDGHLARKHNLITPLGVFLDPLADKLIVTAALIAFVEIPEAHVPAWMVVLIICREFVLTGLRALAATQGRILAADDGGKFKTSVQTASILAILTVLIVHSALERFGGTSVPALLQSTGWRSRCARVLSWTPYWMVFITTATSIGTGLSYLRKNKALFEKDL